MQLKRINYQHLNAKQKETYNFQKVSAVLAEYGFSTIKLNDDWQGSDFIAQHIDGKVHLKVQLKGRLTFDKKYLNKNIYICFRNNDQWYLYPHDKLLNKFLKSFSDSMAKSSSWMEKHGYSFSKLSVEHLKHLKAYQI